MKTCSNCACRFTCYGVCIIYEHNTTEEENIKSARECPDYMDDDEYYYTPSATNGDYSPSNPWDAPGMSVKDFI